MGGHCYSTIITWKEGNKKGGRKKGHKKDRKEERTQEIKEGRD